MKILNVLTVVMLSLSIQVAFAGPTSSLVQGEIGCRITTQDGESDFLKLTPDEENEALSLSFKDFKVTIVNSNNRVLIEKGDVVLASTEIHQKVESNQTTQENYTVNDPNSGAMVVRVGCKRVK